jgi:hypothetical protein
MRDDARQPGGHHQAADEHNYEPAPGEWQEFYDEAREAGASHADASDWASEEIRESPSLYPQFC